MERVVFLEGIYVVIVVAHEYRLGCCYWVWSKESQLNLLCNPACLLQYFPAMRSISSKYLRPREFGLH